VRVGLSYDPLRLSPCSGDLYKIRNSRIQNSKIEFWLHSPLSTPPTTTPYKHTHNIHTPYTHYTHTLYTPWTYTIIHTTIYTHTVDKTHNCTHTPCRKTAV